MSILLQTPKRSTDVLVQCVESNALNCVGQVDMNKFGLKDGQILEKATEIFIDTFILQVLVPDYLIESGRYTEGGSMAKCVWDMLEREGLNKSRATMLNFHKLTTTADQKMIDSMPFKNPNIETNNYFIQTFKISCANEHFEDVIKFLDGKSYQNRGLFLKNIDVTQDYKGSFSKEEIINHLLMSGQFRMQGEYEAEKQYTILDNNRTVGANCMTYVGRWNNYDVRCKIYNKFVQMLESKAVRESIGNHWYHWVNQTNTRLATARDASHERGLTRAEVTISSSANECPPGEHLKEAISELVGHVNQRSLIYSTPFYATWKAYCDAFVHTLVVYHQESDTALMVYSYNELTKKISGHLFQSWADNKEWALANLTLNGEIPIDYIEICNGQNSSNSTLLQAIKVKSQRLFKYKPQNYAMEFETRLVNTNAFFTATQETKMDALSKLKMAGFVPHKNCVPFLAVTSANKRSSPNVKFENVGEFAVCLDSLLTCKTYPKLVTEKIDLQKHLNLVTSQKQIVETILKERKEKMVHIEHFKRASAKSKNISLLDLVGQSLEVMALREIHSCFGLKYTMILKDVNGKEFNCSSNRHIEEKINLCLPAIRRKELQLEPSNYISFCTKPLAVLLVHGYEWSSQNNKIAKCTLNFWESQSHEVLKDGDKNDGFLTTAESVNQIVSCSVPYKHLPDLTTIKVGVTVTIVGKARLEHYRQQKLAIKLSETNTWYKAGKDLENKELNIMTPQKILVIKHRKNVSNNRFEVICNFV